MSLLLDDATAHSIEFGRARSFLEAYGGRTQPASAVTWQSTLSFQSREPPREQMRSDHKGTPTSWGRFRVQGLGF